MSWTNVLSGLLRLLDRSWLSRIVTEVWGFDAKYLLMGHVVIALGVSAALFLQGWAVAALLLVGGGAAAALVCDVGVGSGCTVQKVVNHNC